MSTKDNVAMGLMVMFVADMYTTFPGQITPPIDGRLSAGWKVLGYITATDAVLRIGGQLGKGAEVFYGVLARSLADPTQHVVAVRGTAGIVEWIEDAEFVSIGNPGGPGSVESGFWDIYASMLLKTSAVDVGVSAKAGIAAAVGLTGTVTVVGHSLGSALATYLAFDLAGPTLLGA